MTIKTNIKKIYSHLCRYLQYFLVAAFLFPKILYSQTEEINKLEYLLSKTIGQEKINTLNKLSELTRSFSFEKANKYAEEALKLSEQENYKFGKANAYNNLGFILYRKNDVAKAENFYKSALNIFKELKSDYEIAKTLNYLGLIYWRKNDFVKAFKFYRESLTISQKIKQKDVEAEALDYMGLIYWKWSQYSKALEYFYNSYKLQDQTNNKFGIGIALNNISFIYNEMNQPDLAIYYANKILNDDKITENKYILGRTYNNLGVSYFKKEELDKAISYQQKSLDIKRESGEKGGMAFSYNDLGDVYFKLNDFQLAYENYKLALDLRRELNDKYGIASTLLSIAKVEIKRNKLEEAEFLLNEAIANATSINNISLVTQVYKELSNLYSLKGNNTKAFNYLKLHSELVDSIYNKQSIDKIAELTVIYDLESKENQLKIKTLEVEKEQSKYIYLIIIIILVIVTLIILLIRNKKLRDTTKQLKIKNEEIDKKTIELEQTIKTRDKFFSIMSHDLRSPFFGLKSMTEILSDSEIDLTEEERKNYLSKLNKTVKDVFALIENLIEWSKLQTNRIEHNPENYDLYDDINSIVTMLSINAEHKKIKIENKINPPIEVFADQRMIHSVLLNLISNAIKFTRENGLIEILSNDKGNLIEICVKDNGIGISEEIKSKLFSIETKTSTRGTNQEKGSGLGLLLCKELVEKNGGTITFESKENEGSTFCFTIPKAKN